MQCPRGCVYLFSMLQLNLKTKNKPESGILISREKCVSCSWSQWSLLYHYWCTRCLLATSEAVLTAESFVIDFFGIQRRCQTICYFVPLASTWQSVHSILPSSSSRSPSTLPLLERAHWQMSEMSVFLKRR